VRVSLLTSGGHHSQAELRRAYHGAMLGLAVGNALGAPVEGAPGELVRRRFPDGVRDISHHERERPWDDDVAQAVLLAEALLANGSLDLDDLAARLLEWFRAGGRGIGWLTHQVVTRLAAGGPAAEAARRAWEDSGRSAAGNGAVMRCAPVALRWRQDPERLLSEALALRKE
jgi:ADP-ribosyl-[dinitrogen reductase] hydrolase